MPSGWQTLTGTVSHKLFVEWLPSTASLWRREVFTKLQFDEFFDGYSYLEDLDFSFSVGKRYRLAVVADAGYYHYPSPAGRVSRYQFGKMEVRNRLYLVRKYRLSVWRCYVGLFIRALMTLRSAATDGKSAHFARTLGNSTALLESFTSCLRRSPAIGAR